MKVEVRASEDGAVIFRAEGDVFNLTLTKQALSATEAALHEALQSIQRFKKIVEPSTDRTSHPSES